MRSPPMIVCITGACGNIAYSLYNYLCSGYIFGEDNEIQLRLLQVPAKTNQLQILKLELEDCCYQNVSDIKIFNSHHQKQAFQNADFIIFLGGVARKPGMDIYQVYQENAVIFKTHGKNMNQSAKITCKSLVIANPVNTNCMILADNAWKIPRKNFTALMRLDYNKFMAQILKLFNCKIGQVKNAIVWGNHSRKQFFDLTQVQIQGFQRQAIECKIEQLDYNEVQMRVYDRGGFMLSKQGGNTFLSASKAIIDHLTDWYKGSQRIVSMGIVVDKSIYGIQEGICFSMPTMCTGNGEYKILDDINLNEFQRMRVKEGNDELLKEREIVKQYLREGGLSGASD